MLLELGHDRGSLVSSPRGPFRWNRRWASLPWRAPIGVVSPAYYGVLDEFHYWNAVFSLYRSDHLDAALQVMSEIGIGVYADYQIAGDIVWLEAATSEESEIVRIGDHLEIEIVRDEWPDLNGVVRLVTDAYNQVDRLIGPFEVDTLVTILKRGFEVPTAQWRDGYFVPKQRYGKICLPHGDDETRLERIAARAMIYQQAFELSAGRSDLWLLEASTAIIDDVGALPATWLNPSALRRALAEEEWEEAVRCESARAQARTIGKRLLERGGIDSLLRCLEEHASGKSDDSRATDSALKRVYGFDTLAAFYELPAV